MLKHLAAAALVASLAAPALAQSASDISRVQAGQSCTGCNLFQADVSYMDASGLNVSGSRLRQSNMSLSTFDDSDFSNTNLSVANLFGARFNRSDFSGADMSQASLVGTYFGSSNLSGANLAGANLSGAELQLARGLTQGQLNRACGDSATKLPSGLSIPRCR